MLRGYQYKRIKFNIGRKKCKTYGRICDELGHQKRTNVLLYCVLKLS